MQLFQKKYKKGRSIITKDSVKGCFGYWHRSFGQKPETSNYSDSGGYQLTYHVRTFRWRTCSFNDSRSPRQGDKTSSCNHGLALRCSTLMRFRLCVQNVMIRYFYMSQWAPCGYEKLHQSGKARLWNYDFEFAFNTCPSSLVSVQTVRLLREYV